MLQLSGMIINRPVFSLRTGTQVATTLNPIINPNNLKIEGFYCKASGRQRKILVTQDIRDVLPQGMVINDEDVLAETGDLIRLKEIMDINFELIGKQVQTVSRHKLGKISDYATETQSMIIKKLYVAQPIYKNLRGGDLSIDRTHIVEITNKKIVVRDIDAKVPAPAGVMAA